MKNLITLLTVIISVNLCAQNFDISGFVKSENNTVLPYSTVILKSSSDSSMVKTAVTDFNGNFKLPSIAQGSYFISVMSFGFIDMNSEEFDLDSDYVLPDMIMSENSTLINTVEITAKKAMIEVMPDKTVFNVQNSLNTVGTNGFDLLRKAPGLVIDNSNNLILEGKTGAQIWVDGKPLQLAGDDLVNYLKSLQASEIQSIEMITQPNSKFDAAGSAGIINIKLKKDLRFGTNGTLNTGYAIGKYPRYNGSLSINNRGKKANVFGMYSYNNFKSYNFINLYRQQNGLAFDQRSTTVYDGQSHNVRGGADFFVSTKSTVGVVFNGTFNDNVNSRRSRTPISSSDDNQVSQVLNSNNFGETENERIFANVNYRFEDTLGHKFSADLDYGTYTNNTLNFQPKCLF